MSVADDRERSQGRAPHGRPAVCLVYYQMFNALLHREARALAAAGFAVDVVCYATTESEPRVRHPEGFRVIFLGRRREKEKALAAYLARMAAFTLRTGWFLSKAALRRGYRVIQFTTPPDAILMTGALARLFGARIVMDIHDIGPEFVMQKRGLAARHPLVKLLRLAERLAVRLSDQVFVVTELWRGRLLERGASAEKCTTLLNVPDDDLFRPLPGLPAGERRGFRLLYHGSLEERCGVDTLIEAMPAIRYAIPAVRLDIYGRGLLHAECRLRAARLGLEGTVRFHDHVAHGELPRIIADADLGVVPTKGGVFSGDILAMKSLEILAMGVPAVVSATAGHRHYFTEETVAFFEPGDAGDLARAVCALHRDAARRERLARAGPRFMRRRGWHRERRKYIEVFQRLAGVRCAGDTRPAAARAGAGAREAAC